MPEPTIDPARLCNRLMRHILDNEVWHDHWQYPATWRFYAEAYFPATDYLPRGLGLDSAGIELCFPQPPVADYRLKISWHLHGALYATTASWSIQTGKASVTTVTPLDGTHGLPDLRLLQRWLMAGLVARIKRYRQAFDALEATAFMDGRDNEKEGDGLDNLGTQPLGIQPAALTPEDRDDYDDLKVPLRDLDPYNKDAGEPKTAAQLAAADLPYRQRNERFGFGL